MQITSLLSLESETIKNWLYYSLPPGDREQSAAPILFQATKTSRCAEGRGRGRTWMWMTLLFQTLVNDVWGEEELAIAAHSWTLLFPARVVRSQWQLFCQNDSSFQRILNPTRVWGLSMCVSTNPRTSNLLEDSHISQIYVLFLRKIIFCPYLKIYLYKSCLCQALCKALH